MKVYTQDDLGKCKVCHATAIVIISKQMKGMTVLFSYCDFHAEIAKQLFGSNAARVELKGGFQLA